MMVTFANNQVIVNDGSATSEITTDPVALGNNDRLSPTITVHYIYGTPPTLTYKSQVSNDGVHFVDDGVSGTVAAAGTTQVTPAQVNGAYVRMHFDLSDSVDCAVCFDFHSKLDHA